MYALSSALGVLGMYVLGLLVWVIVRSWVRWSRKRHAPEPTVAEVLAKMQRNVEQVGRALGESLTPALRDAIRATNELGRALCALKDTPDETNGGMMP